MDMRRSIYTAFILNFIFLIVEIIGGIMSNSLALIADAGHMFTDVSALALSIIAMNIAARLPTLKKTFGYQRAEIVAAFINGITLWLIVILITYEAIKRLISPPEVKSLEMLAISIIGFVANFLSTAILFKHSRHNLNIKGAFLHLLSDTLGSIGVIIGAIIINFTGWVIVDPIISIFIGILIVAGSLDLLKESLNILMLGAPSEIDVQGIKKGVEELKGVKNVHDIHVWTISKDKNALSAHVVVDKNINSEEKLREIIDYIVNNFGIEHITIQVESENLQPIVCEECGAPI